MSERKFTPPTEFPTDYIDGIGRKVTIYAMGHGQQPLLGQYDNGAMVSFDLNGYYGISDEEYYGISDEDYALHDIPKRIVSWYNVYAGGILLHHDCRDMADYMPSPNRLCVYRIECDEDGSNPELFVEDV